MAYDLCKQLVSILQHSPLDAALVGICRIHRLPKIPIRQSPLAVDVPDALHRQMSYRREVEARNLSMRYS